MSPPPGFDHRQGARVIANLLDGLHPGELATVEQAILTRDGQVRIADVVLLAKAQKSWLLANPTSPLPTAPPVSVEILSPSNDFGDRPKTRPHLRRWLHRSLDLQP